MKLVPLAPAVTVHLSEITKRHPEVKPALHKAATLLQRPSGLARTITEDVDHYFPIFVRPETGW